MKKNKLMILGLGFGLILSAAFYFSNRPQSAKTTHIVRKAKLAPEWAIPSESQIAAMKASTPGERGASPAASDADPEFVRWFAMEAQHLQARETHSLATEKELKARAAKFSSKDISYLASRSTSALVPASERILASYLMGLSAEQASEALVDIASQAPTNPGPHEAHSIDEVKSAQERAHKIMAVDAIYNSQSEISHKIEKLQSIVNQSPDTTVKKYAADKVSDLNSTF